MKNKCYKLMGAVCGVVLGLNINTYGEETHYQPISFTAEAGTTGLGGTFGFRFADHLGVRVGGHFFDLDYEPEIEGVKYDVNLKLQSIPVALDIFTSKKGSFRVTLGAMLNNKYDITGNTPVTAVEVNGVTYNSALSLKVERETVAPFVTVGGTIYFNDKKNIGLNIEGGVAYMGKADVSLTSTAGDPLNPADVAAEIEEIEDNANMLKIYPIFKIGFTVSF